MSSRAGIAKSRVFNVLRYGAVGDDKTDNTEAFSACLKAVVEAGGGRMYVPDGVYRGHIVIPAVPKTIPSWITVEIVGESEPTPVFGTIGSFPLLNDGDNIIVASNVNGLEFLQAHHASRFARVGSYRNTHHVTVSGRHGFSIEQLNTEQPGQGQTDGGNAWQTLVSDVDDPQNLGVADINYWVVIGGVGARDTFIKNGGASIRARRIGSAPAGGESTGK